jgi:hypothetical protein
MNEKDFDNLLGSIRQAGKVRRSEAKPGRITEFAPIDVRAIRDRLAKSQEERGAQLTTDEYPDNLSI